MLAAAALAAVAVAATAAGIATRGGGGGDSERPSPAPKPPVAASPSPEVGKTVKPVGFRPRGIAVLDGDLWVISAARERVARISADTMRPHGAQPRIGRGAVSIAARGDSIWVAITRQGSVIELDSRTGSVRARLSVPVAPFLVAAGAGGLWVVGHGKGAAPDVLFHYDRARRLVGRAEVQADVTALAVGGGTAWIAHAGTHRILGYDDELSVRHRTWPENEVLALAYGGGHLWASVPDADSVARYDPRKRLLVKTRAARSPAGLAIARGRVFVASHTDHAVVAIDPDTTRAVGDPLPVPLNPWAVAAGAGHLWVTGLGASTLTRIDY